MRAFEDTQWDKDYRLVYGQVVRSYDNTAMAAKAGRNYADGAADLRAQLVLREVEGRWDWEAGAYCSTSTYPTEAEAREDFEATLYDVVGC